MHLRDEGIRHDVIDACLAMPGADDLTLLVKRAEALSAFLKTDDGENLVQGFQRANNILTQAEAKDGVEYSFGADRKFADDPAEVALFDALDAAEAEIAPAMEAEDFGAAMAAMARLRAPIDAFFEAVQVNAESPGAAAQPAEPAEPDPATVPVGGGPDQARRLGAAGRSPAQPPGRLRRCAKPSVTRWR